jgi:hypothetical protein
MSEISKRIEADRNSDRVKRARRDSGSGCLIPPRPGVTRFWSGQLYDMSGRLVRRTLRDASGARVAGEWKPRKNVDGRVSNNSKDPQNWTNLTAARIALDKLRGGVGEGSLAIGIDPSQVRYGDLRKLYLDYYAEQEHKSLRTNTVGEVYVDNLKHLDEFFGFNGEDEQGLKVQYITVDKIDDFKKKRQKEGAANATINRSLSALTKMFNLAVEKKKLWSAPVIHHLPEPKQPRSGFLDTADYDRLYAEFGREVVTKQRGG